MKETYIIGDIHGCFHTFEKLLTKLPSQCELIFVGDLCDRGAYSKDMIEWVMQSGALCLMGNHEFVMLQSALEDLKIPRSTWATNPDWGGAATLANYKDDEAALKRHLEWMAKLPYYLLHEHFFITHGFGLPYYARRDTAAYRERLLWNRVEEPRDDWENYESHEVMNIFGHTPYPEPLVAKNYRGIDTGCVYGGMLTALHLPTLEVITAPFDQNDRPEASAYKCDVITP